MDNPTANGATMHGVVPGDVQVREATPAELDRVGTLTLRSYDRLDAKFSGDYRIELGDAHKRAATDALIMVGLLGDEVAGSLTLSLGNTEMFEHAFGVDGDCGFRMLAVEPGMEGRGVGRALVLGAIARCKSVGARRMVITSMDFMPRAHRMYQRFGFVRRPDLDVRFPSGVGMGFNLDLTADAPAHFAAPGPAPAAPPWYLDLPQPPDVPCA
ncbi:MAG: GNAT superfamily N-acetyltransferase [Glaciecola sp.]